MIRRSPTRLELKLDDIQEFEYIQKTDRKRVMLAAAGNEEARKLLRQERIGYLNPPATIAGTRTRRNAAEACAAAAAAANTNTTTPASTTGTTFNTAMSSAAGGSLSEFGTAIAEASGLLSTPGPSQRGTPGSADSMIFSTNSTPSVVLVTSPITTDNDSLGLGPDPEGDESSNMSIDTEDEDV